MAGSYRHITKTDGSFRGVDLLDNLGDAYEALEECHGMIGILANGDKLQIYEAWLAWIETVPGAEMGRRSSLEEFWASDEEDEDG